MPGPVSDHYQGPIALEPPPIQYSVYFYTGKRGIFIDRIFLRVFIGNENAAIEFAERYAEKKNIPCYVPHRDGKDTDGGRHDFVRVEKQ